MKSDIIFLCHSKFVSYYPSKVFVIHENNSSALINVTLRVKKIINSELIYINNLVMSCYRAIPSASNTFKIVPICSGLYTDFVSMYYIDKVYAFLYFLENISSRILSKLDILH